MLDELSVIEQCIFWLFGWCSLRIWGRKWIFCAGPTAALPGIRRRDSWKRVVTHSLSPYFDVKRIVVGRHPVFSQHGLEEILTPSF